MPLLVNCVSCDELFDECGGSMSRGRHYAPFCSRYCRIFHREGYQLGQYPHFERKCDWCGAAFQLTRGKYEGSQRVCSLKCSREARAKRNNKAHRVLQTMKILARPVSAHEIAYELSKIPCNGWRNTLGSQSVANVLKLLKARGAVKISMGKNKQAHIYKLRDPNAPFKQYGKPA